VSSLADKSQVPAASSPVSVRTIPNPREPVPAIALPALGLFVAGLALFFGSVALAWNGSLPWPLSVLLSTVAAYMLFTVAHDASHRSLSRYEPVNVWLGRISLLFFAPIAGFATWRYIHMQHHRFTNDHGGNDPDGYTMRGPGWQRPLRWLTIDLYYMRWYLPRLASRPRKDKIELGATWLVLVGAIAAFVATGHVVELLVLVLLPLRLAVMWLGFAFDYLPHHGLHHTPTEDKFKTTRNRIGLERVLSPLLLYQNYHLVHHLHPLIPFHRYIAVWRRNEDRYLEGDPALSTVGGRPITTDEYRRLRELADHH
jgi:ring-1,2-phenylacetyl-CoA epoxidase subunit PaaE